MDFKTNPSIDGIKLALSVSSLTGPAGCIAETSPRLYTSFSTTTTVTLGQLYATMIVLPGGLLVSSINWLANGTLTSPTNQWSVLLNNAFQPVGFTNDLTNAAWTSNTVQSFPIASPVRTPYTGLYYLGLLVAASSGSKTLTAIGSSFTSDKALAPAMAWTDTTHGGLTTTASAPGTFTPGTAKPPTWGYLT